MPRRKKIDRSTKITLTVAESIRAKVEIELFSSVQGRVPYGAWAELVNELLGDWLKTRGVVV